jgi:hypothetical protein
MCENSVVWVAAYTGSMAFLTAVGTGYSAMKLPLVSLTFLTIPRFTACLCLRLQRESRETTDMRESFEPLFHMYGELGWNGVLGRLKGEGEAGIGYRFGSIALGRFGYLKWSRPGGARWRS